MRIVKKNAVETKSPELQQVFSYVPSWIVRSGLMILLLVIVSVLVISWFIKYPEIISASITLTSQNPSTGIVAKSTGKIKLFVKEFEKVKANEILAVIVNSAKTEDALLLSNYVKRNVFSSLTDYRSYLKALDGNLELGELEDAYIYFLRTLKEYALYKDLDLYNKQIRDIEKRISNHYLLNRQLKIDKEISGKQLTLVKKKYEIDSALGAKRIYSNLEIDRSESTFLDAKKIFNSTISHIIQNEIEISALESNVIELKLEDEKKSSTLEREVLESFNRLKAQVEMWEQKYLLKSPIDGEVSLSNFWADHQTVREDDEVLTIIPLTFSRIIGSVKMPMIGSGKVEIGQKVIIKLDGFPSAEYGVINGKITSISKIPKDSLYYVKVRLPNGLKTNYKKTLQFKQEMTGNASIITKDLSVLERIFNQFKDLFNKS